MATLVMLTGALGIVGLLASAVGGFVGADGFYELILRLGIVVTVVAAQAGRGAGQSSHRAHHRLGCHDESSRHSSRTAPR